LVIRVKKAHLLRVFLLFLCVNQPALLFAKQCRVQLEEYLVVRMRLLRSGTKRKPFYKIVVAKSQCPRDGRFIEIIGRYQPVAVGEQVTVSQDRVDFWMKNGAQPTQIVRDLIRKAAPKS
jgi:small subunit ribosomal protein S16